MKRLLVLLLTLASASISQANLQFFGGVTDPGIFEGEFTYTWPDRSFTRLGFYSGATCTDSTSQYQIQTGVNTFNGSTGKGWTPLTIFYNWTRQNHLKFMWYGGYAASINGIWPANIGITGSAVVTAFDNFARTAARMYPNIEYINFANEPMHGGPSGNVQNAFGGAGASGYDWIIAIGKIYRQYFPNAKLGINDFQMESVANDLPYDHYGTEQTMLPQFLEMVEALKAAGVIDWVGLESYSLETVPSANFTAALNQIGALGVKIILTEFSPDAYTVASPSKVLSDWQRLLPLAVANQYVIGVTGPWTFRKSVKYAGASGSQALVDDTVTPAQDSLTVTWLKSFRFDTLRPAIPVQRSRASP
jgi:endo-1,4-beta-xylanase